MSWSAGSASLGPGEGPGLHRRRGRHLDLPAPRTGHRRLPDEHPSRVSAAPTAGCSPAAIPVPGPATPRRRPAGTVRGHRDRGAGPGGEALDGTVRWAEGAEDRDPGRRGPRPRSTSPPSASRSPPTVERARADDPQELRRTIAGLQHQPATRPEPAPPDRIEVPVLTVETLQTLQQGRTAWDASTTQLRSVLDAIDNHLTAVSADASNMDLRRRAGLGAETDLRPVSFVPQGFHGRQWRGTVEDGGWPPLRTTKPAARKRYPAARSWHGCGGEICSEVGVMALSEYEQRRLDEMETALRRDDPSFAASVSDRSGPPSSADRRGRGVRPLEWSSWSMVWSPPRRPCRPVC